MEEDSPYEEIRYLDNVSENYVVSWKILDEASNNERFQLKHNLYKLFKIPTMNKKNFASIKTFKQELNGVLFNLRGEKVTWEDIVCFYAVNRFDAACQEEFYRELVSLKRASHIISFRICDTFK